MVEFEANRVAVVAHRGRRVRWLIGISLMVEIVALFLFSSLGDPLRLMTPI